MDATATQTAPTCHCGADTIGHVHTVIDREERERRRARYAEADTDDIED